MKDESAVTVAFTGHRTYCNDADAALRRTVGELYARGFRTFLCGMAVGFDLAAAEAVLACRDAAAVRPGCSATAVPDAVTSFATAPDTPSLAAPGFLPAFEAGFHCPDASASRTDRHATDASVLDAGLACRASGTLPKIHSADIFSTSALSSDPRLPDTFSPDAPVSSVSVSAARHEGQNVTAARLGCPVSDTSCALAPDALACVDSPAPVPMPDLRLVAVVPFRGQESRFSTADRARFHRVLAAADEVVVLAPAYRPGCYAVRNNYLTDHASLLVAWYDGSPGGTHYTVRRALSRGLEFINLHRAAPPVPQPDPTLF